MGAGNLMRWDRKDEKLGGGNLSMGRYKGRGEGRGEDLYRVLQWEKAKKKERSYMSLADAE